MKPHSSRIRIAAILATTSFLLYLSPAQPILVSAEQANEALLAIFGAGISVLPFEIIDYIRERKRLEKAFLDLIEPALSNISALEWPTIECMGGGSLEGDVKILYAYFREREANDFALNLKLPTSTKAADTILEYLSVVSTNERNAQLNDPNSNFNRLINRQEGRIKHTLKIYADCSEKLACVLKQMRDIQTQLDYLPRIGIDKATKSYSSNSNKAEVVDRIVKFVSKNPPMLKPCLASHRSITRYDSTYSDLLGIEFDVWNKLESFSKSCTTGKASNNALADQLLEFARQFERLTTRDETYTKLDPWW